MIRVGLICDFSDEQWPSMDHYGNMLVSGFNSQHRRDLAVERIEPPFRHLTTQIPGLRSSQNAENCDRLWNRMFEYPRWLRRRTQDFDVFHIVDHSYSHLALTLPATRTIISCHDLNTFGAIIDPGKERRSIWYKAMTKHILRGFQAAHHVVFLSQTVREEAIKLGLIQSARSSVIYGAADDINQMDPAADAAVGSLLGPVCAEPLLLHVGSTVSRKRIDILLRILAAVAAVRPDVRLIRVGAPLTAGQVNLAKDLMVEQLIVELPFVDRAFLSALYRRASLLVHPSDAEGFGLTIVEAMRAGCPAVVSDLPVLREIGGVAAIYCQRGNIGQWTSTILQLLESRMDSPLLWNALCESSRRNANRFSWEETARLSSNVYCQAIRNAHVVRF